MSHVLLRFKPVMLNLLLKDTPAAIAAAWSAYVVSLP